MTQVKYADLHVGKKYTMSSNCMPFPSELYDVEIISKDRKRSTVLLNVKMAKMNVRSFGPPLPYHITFSKEQIDYEYATAKFYRW